jgi:hypothetical protein
MKQQRSDTIILFAGLGAMLAIVMLVFGVGRIGMTPTATIAGQAISTGDAIYETADKVGIGTTNPAARLEVAGGQTYLHSSPTAGSGPTLHVRSDTGSGAVAVFGDSGGSVGIGTTTPGSKLEVAGGQTYLHSNPTAGSGPTLHVRSDTGSGTVAVLGDTGGNVGIGTANPTYKLDVNGKIQATGIDVAGVTRINGVLQVRGSSSTNSGTTIAVFGDNGGNVGIGTTSPKQALDVSGAVRLQPTQLEACDSTIRGSMRFVAGSTTDNVAVCMMRNGTYGWQNLAMK